MIVKYILCYKHECFSLWIGIAVISGAFCYDVVLDNKLNDWKPTKVSTFQT